MIFRRNLVFDYIHSPNSKKFNTRLFIQKDTLVSRLASFFFLLLDQSNTKLEFILDFYFLEMCNYVFIKIVFTKTFLQKKLLHGFIKFAYTVCFTIKSKMVSNSNVFSNIFHIFTRKDFFLPSI